MMIPICKSPNTFLFVRWALKVLLVGFWWVNPGAQNSQRSQHTVERERQQSLSLASFCLASETSHRSSAPVHVYHPLFRSCFTLAQSVPPPPAPYRCCFLFYKRLFRRTIRPPHTNERNPFNFSFLAPINKISKRFYN